jgi:poly(glycerol-phosphate) alpha-glucosyltransferase
MPARVQKTSIFRTTGAAWKKPSKPYLLPLEVIEMIAAQREPAQSNGPDTTLGRQSIHADTRQSLKIGMLVGSMTPGRGGVDEAVRSLSGALQKQRRFSLDIFSLQHDHPGETVMLDQVPLTLVRPIGPRGFGYSPDLASTLRSSAPQLIHVHGLWMYQSLAARRWALATGSPYIVSPHGMLDPWALRNSRWKKILASQVFEAAHLRDAACLHALCESELQSIRAYGLKNPVCVIPNGVYPAFSQLTPPDWRANLPAEKKVLLYLGRLHPKKGLRNLILAWSELNRQALSPMADWSLVIAGSGRDAYVRELHELVRAHGLENSVVFVGPQYGSDKHATFQAADAFILPSVSEGLPIAVLEAWAYSLPALITSSCNLPEGVERKAAVQIGADVGDIAKGLAVLFFMSPQALKKMGQAAAQLAADTFNWDLVASRFGEVYRWLLGEAPRPDSVHYVDN